MNPRNRYTAGRLTLASSFKYPGGASQAKLGNISTVRKGSIGHRSLSAQSAYNFGSFSASCLTPVVRLLRAALGRRPHSDQSTMEDTDSAGSAPAQSDDSNQMIDVTIRDEEIHDRGVAERFVVEEEFWYGGERVERETTIQLLEDDAVHIYQGLYGGVMTDDVTLSEPAIDELVSRRRDDQVLVDRDVLDELVDTCRGKLEGDVGRWGVDGTGYDVDAFVDVIERGQAALDRDAEVFDRE